jgi:hypothetical protein
MRRRLIATMFFVALTSPVVAEETFYIIYDSTMKGCTILTTEPSDKTRYKTVGKFKSESEAEKAIPSMKEC